MMYKLILVASAVNADSDHPKTADLLSMACSMVTLLPGTVSATAEATANSYLPIHFSHGDLKTADTLAQKACESVQKGQTWTEAAKDQLFVLKSEAFPDIAGSVAGKATKYFLGTKSKIAEQAKALVTQIAATHTLGSQVDMALKFVTFIDTVDDDKNTHMGYGDVLPAPEAAKMKKLVKDVKKDLKTAYDNGEKQLSCGSDLYIQLQDLVKNGVYDELLSKVSSTKEGTLQDIGTKVLARTAVSKVVSFTDCKEKDTPARILLA